MNQRCQRFFFNFISSLSTNKVDIKLFYLVWYVVSITFNSRTKCPKTEISCKTHVKDNVLTFSNIQFLLDIKPNTPLTF